MKGFVIEKYFLVKTIALLKTRCYI